MKPKKSSKGVSNCPFLFLEKKHQGKKLESAYSDKPQLAISGTNHTVTTPKGRVIHRKTRSKPIDFNQEYNNRGTGPRGPRRPICQITIQTTTGNDNRLGRRIGSTVNGYRQPKDARAPYRHNHQEEHIRPRTPKIDSRSRQPKQPTHLCREAARAR